MNEQIPDKQLRWVEVQALPEVWHLSFGRETLCGYHKLGTGMDWSAQMPIGDFMPTRRCYRCGENIRATGRWSRLFAPAPASGGSNDDRWHWEDALTFWLGCIAVGSVLGILVVALSRQ